MKNRWRTVKNDHGIDHRNILEARRPRFFFFLILLSNFTQILSILDVGPFSSTPSRLFIGNEGWRLHSSSPRQVGYFSLKLASGPRGWKMPQTWPFCPPFGLFCTFPSETFKNLMDYTTIGVKKLNSVGKNPNVCKWSSPDEIRVWQLPFFTYLLLEIKWK